MLDERPAPVYNKNEEPVQTASSTFVSSKNREYTYKIQRMMKLVPRGPGIRRAVPAGRVHNPRSIQLRQHIQAVEFTHVLVDSLVYHTGGDFSVMEDRLRSLHQTVQYAYRNYQQSAIASGQYPSFIKRCQLTSSLITPQFFRLTIVWDDKQRLRLINTLLSAWNLYVKEIAIETMGMTLDSDWSYARFAVAILYCLASSYVIPVREFKTDTLTNFCIIPLVPYLECVLPAHDYIPLYVGNANQSSICQGQITRGKNMLSTIVNTFIQWCRLRATTEDEFKTMISKLKLKNRMGGV